MRRQTNLPKGSLTLIGSGEMAPAMGKVHRALLSKMVPPVRAVFIDTPAGFQLNVDHISDKAASYFRKHLNIPLLTASYKSSDAPLADEEMALSHIQSAGYIFAGPGSPSYTIRNWENTRILSALYSRLMDGAHLVFASAASIALSSFALPVYEVYKVGEPPHWINGLNFLTPLGFHLAVIPHWNNREGGTHDTRFCYMGTPRFEVLEKQLPPSAAILGIDEHTAVTFDFPSGYCRVMGDGTATLRKSGENLCFQAGEAFGMALLKGVPPDGRRKEAAFVKMAAAVFTGVERLEKKEEDGTEIPEDIIRLLVRIRSRLRSEDKWELADEIRGALSSFHIMIEDGPDGSSWKKNG